MAADEQVEAAAPGGRAIAVPLVIAAVLVALAFGGSAYGARRTEDGMAEAAKRTTTTNPEAPVTGPPKAKPVRPGAALTGDTPCPKADGTSPRTDTFAKEPPVCIDPAKTYTATFKTTAGPVVAALDGSRKATNNFVVLARYHYYDGSALFQTIPNIDVLVGGSPKTQSSSDPGPGYTFLDKPADATTDPATGQPKGTYTYTEGVLGMAPVNEAFEGSSSFFFGAGKNVSQLDSQGVYLVFGRVTKGLDVVKRVMASHVPCPPADPECLSGGPDPAVTVSSVTIEES